MHCELSSFIFNEERIDSVRRSAADSTYNPDAPIIPSLADQRDCRGSCGLDGNRVVAWRQDTLAPVDLVRQRELSAAGGKLSLRSYRANKKQAHGQGGQQHSNSRHSLICSHGFFPFGLRPSLPLARRQAENLGRSRVPQ